MPSRASNVVRSEPAPRAASETPRLLFVGRLSPEKGVHTLLQARATLRTDVIAASPSAKPYSAGERLYGLVNGELMWTFDMAAVGEPMTNHLSARLRPAD